MAPFSIPGGAVADHPVELRPQLRDDLCDPVLGQAILVLALRGRQQSERVQALVSNEGLRELGLAFDDVDEIKDHPSLGTHHEVEIAQADIEVDDHHLLSSLCKRRPQRCCRGRLADSALPRGHHEHLALSDLCLCLGSLWPWLLHRWHFSRETVRRHGTDAGTRVIEGSSAKRKLTRAVSPCGPSKACPFRAQDGYQEVNDPQGAPMAAEQAPVSDLLTILR